MSYLESFYGSDLSTKACNNSYFNRTRGGHRSQTLLQSEAGASTCRQHSLKSNEKRRNNLRYKYTQSVLDCPGGKMCSIDQLDTAKTLARPETPQGRKIAKEVTMYPSSSVPGLMPNTLKVDIMKAREKCRPKAGMKRLEESLEQRHVQYIPLKWEDLLGGKEGLENLAVTMSSGHNGNNKMKLSVGGLRRPPSNGDLPMKVISFNAVPNYPEVKAYPQEAKEITDSMAMTVTGRASWLDGATSTAENVGSYTKCPEMKTLYPFSNRRGPVVPCKFSRCSQGCPGCRR